MSTTPLSIQASPKQELCDFEVQHSLDVSSPYPVAGSAAQGTPEPTPEKKPVKKRKSWGQELPTPTTNLPPRKRAKTEAEKEQRRIERVLRNRAAAQSSRERKRKEVEALEEEKNTLAIEVKNLQDAQQYLIARLQTVMKHNETLQCEMNNMMRKWESTRGPAYKMANSSPNQPLLTPASPNQPLLTPASMAHDSFSGPPSQISSPQVDDGTLNPSYLSCKNEDPFSMTQHTAVMLCPSDLPCQLTGPSLQVRLILVVLRWALFFSAISQAPLEMVAALLTNPRTTTIPASAQPPQPSPSTPSLASQRTTTSSVFSLDFLSRTRALQSDATSSVRGFDTADREMGSFERTSNLDKKGQEQGADPVWDCRKFVMGLGGGKEGGGIGPLLSEVIESKQKEDHGKGIGDVRDGFDFSTVLSFDWTWRANVGLLAV